MRRLHAKVTAEMEGEFVVFLIGMRINKPWKIHKWLPVFLAMPRMLRELSRHPELGLLGHPAFPGIIVQYWRTFDDLEAYARGDHNHLSAWRKFNQRVRAGSGDVGIWHETYRVGLGQYEAVYGIMPSFGLGAAGRVVPAVGQRGTARDRLEGGDTGRDEHARLTAASFGWYRGRLPRRCSRWRLSAGTHQRGRQRCPSVRTSSSTPRFRASGVHDVGSDLENRCDHERECGEPEGDRQWEPKPVRIADRNDCQDGCEHDD